MTKCELGDLVLLLYPEDWSNYYDKCKLELYRRKASPCEDRKREESGDVCDVLK